MYEMEMDKVCDKCEQRERERERQVVYAVCVRIKCLLRCKVHEMTRDVRKRFMSDFIECTICRSERSMEIDCSYLF